MKFIGSIKILRLKKVSTGQYSPLYPTNRICIETKQTVKAWKPQNSQQSLVNRNVLKSNLTYQHPSSTLDHTHTQPSQILVTPETTNINTETLLLGTLADALPSINRVISTIHSGLQNRSTCSNPRWAGSTTDYVYKVSRISTHPNYCTLGSSSTVAGHRDHGWWITGVVLQPLQLNHD